MASIPERETIVKFLKISRFLILNSVLLLADTPDDPDY